MILSANAKSGDNGNAVVGDNNIFNQTIFQQSMNPMPKRSVIFEVCTTISKADIDCADDYSIKRNVDWIKKLEYNDVERYSEIFDTYCVGYETVEDILAEYKVRDRDIMVRKVNATYKSVEADRERLGENGDYVLEHVYKKLEEIVFKYAGITGSSESLEELEEAIYLIMFYVFTKCLLLKKPPKGEE